MAPSEKHLFALYSPLFFLSQSAIPGDHISCKNEELWTRITKIIRLEVGEHVIIFNDHHHVTLKLTHDNFSKKNYLSGIIVQYAAHKKLSPELILYQGITKKPAYEEICYAAAQLGISRIIPVKTAKSQRMWEGSREHERLRKIMIAACEQSKQFILPQLEEPATITQICATAHGNKLLFDQGGMNILDAVATRESVISCLIGPEGGITQEERILLEKNNFNTVNLTPTVLRAQDAAQIALGALRCIIA